MQRPMLRVDQQQLPSQVARALARVMSTGGGSMTLRLNPQSLGDVRVEISIQRGAATAIFDAENQSARDLLKSEIDHLRSALERRGVVVERLEVRDAGTARVSEAEGPLHGGKNESSEDETSSRGRQEWSPPTRNGSFADTNENAVTQVRAEPASGDWTPTLHVEVRAEGTLRLEALA
ncbi:MAG: flagellar hook-length control protein FliK [Phycisphaeraceae bacterium]|nr:flagellar hook-length control protein FliK [Phycisphaeraceae bacterium]MCW5762612.1 flagellar hook-length control protein FliK [Phycisphaeraceae bacterium]